MFKEELYGPEAIAKQPQPRRRAGEGESIHLPLESRMLPATTVLAR